MDLFQYHSGQGKRSKRNGALTSAVFLFLALVLQNPVFAGWRGAAGKADITPDLSRPVYLAGYGAQGRPARGVRDPLYARAAALSDGNKTVVLVGLDFIGFARPQVEKIRSAFPDAYILVASVHTHSGPDTLGLWGPEPGIGGVDPVYIEDTVTKVQALIADLLKRLEPVSLTAAARKVPVAGLVRDLRDPMVIDDEMGVLVMKSRSSGRRVASIVSWSCHPEVLGRDNFEITGDFASYLTRELELLTGGTAVFFAGSIGGLMSPDARAPTFGEAERIGKELAHHAVDAAADAQPVGQDAALAVSSTTVLLPIENILYLAFLENVRQGRPIVDAQGRPWKDRYWKHWGRHMRLFFSWLDARVFGRVFPYLETEAALVRLGGAASLLAVPGEIFPELVLGGYGGEFKFHYPLTKPDNPRPPDVNRAPKGPYLKEKMPGRVRMIIGLANDEIGYIVPEYDFRINAMSPAMHPRPKGHHYEETNSLGRRATPLLLQAIERLINPTTPQGQSPIDPPNKAKE
ncbi:MAG: hypothetical protein HYT79_08560 [Elusimicrobia bacterium]|nr:hypothetical protein [Elusimicrobiota bacterium]